MTDNHEKLLVLGIGNPNCGDDAVGPTVVKRIMKYDTHDIVSLAIPCEPSSIISAMKGHSHVVLVDAILSHNAAGTIHVFDATHGALPTDLFEHFSTHSFGLSDAIELARALGELPEKILVLGIEGENFEPEDELSPRVDSAIDEAIHWIFERADSLSPHKSDTTRNH